MHHRQHAGLSSHSPPLVYDADSSSVYSLRSTTDEVCIVAKGKEIHSV